MKNRIAGPQSRPAAAPAFAGRTQLPASPADQQSQFASAPAGGSELLTVHQIAARLQVSVSGLRKLQARRLIPVVRIGRKCSRYRWRDVEKALEKLTIREVA